MKLREYAPHIGDEDIRRQFLEHCAGADKAFTTMADLLVSERGYQVPCESDDGMTARIVVKVSGKPTDEDWRRLQAFAAIARGEFDTEDADDPA